MPRSSSSKPWNRAMAILALPLTPISKAKGPIARNLLLFKKRGAAGKRFGYKTHRHYNYAYVGEYQFSPSGSPLIAYPPGVVSSWRRAARKRRSKARMILASLLCGGDGYGGGDLDVAVLDGLPRADEPLAVEWEERPRDGESYGEEDGDEEEEDEGIDGRAERFIERFYEEMRLQRQRSLLQRLL
uniref:Uncharacterized protein n=1 Tax=Leersia perrieri TaxID=77586 RepID=A0A0D9UWF9_9ORYZ